MRCALLPAARRIRLMLLQKIVSNKIKEGGAQLSVVCRLRSISVAVACQVAVAVADALRAAASCAQLSIMFSIVAM